MLNIEKIIKGYPVSIEKSDSMIEIVFQLSYATLSSITLCIKDEYLDNTFTTAKSTYYAEISGFDEPWEEFITEKYDNPEWFHDTWEKLHDLAAKFILERRDEKKELPNYF